MSVDILSADRYFSHHIKSFNQDKEIDLNKVETFSKLIIRMKGANDPAVTDYIMRKIENKEAKETLGYLLGISEVVPQLIPEELKLKYQLLRMVRPTEHFKRKKLLAAYDGIPETERLDIIEKLATVLNGKRVNPRNVLEFAALLEGMGKQSLEERNRVLEDFQKLIDQNDDSDNLIMTLSKFFSVGPQEWPHVVDRVGLMTAQTQEKLNIYTFFEFFAQPYKEEKENWIELMEEASDLVIKMDGNCDCFQLIHAMTALEDLSPEMRCKLVKVLSQLKGMGDTVELLTKMFLGISDQEWPEMVDSFHKLDCKHSCNNLVLLKAIAKGRPGERLRVIDLVDDFISKLNKEKGYASEKARLLEAASEAPQGKLETILNAAFALYEEFKTNGRELSRVELAKYIRVLSAEGKPQLEKAVSAFENYEGREKLLRVFNIVPLTEWPELAACCLKLPGHNYDLDYLRTIAEAGKKGERLAVMMQVDAFVKGLKKYPSFKDRIFTILANTPSDRRPHAMDCTLNLWHALKGKSDSYYSQFLSAFGMLSKDEALELQDLCLEHLAIGLFDLSVDELIQIAAENPQRKREQIIKDARKLHDELMAIGKEQSGFELVKYTKLVSCIPETKYTYLKDLSEKEQSKLKEAVLDLAQDRYKGYGEVEELPKIFHDLPLAKWPEMAACFLKLSVLKEYFKICDIARKPPIGEVSRLDVAKQFFVKKNLLG